MAKQASLTCFGLPKIGQAELVRHWKMGQKLQLAKNLFFLFFIYKMCLYIYSYK